jgi:DNA primase
VTINTILERLEQVKGINGKYQARCPAHDDKDPSMAITETADGTVLIKCFAGCTADEIVGAIGLELKDLFPESNMTASQKQAYAKNKTRADIESALYHELIVVTQIIASRVNDRQLPVWMRIPDEHWDRELLAQQRIRKSLGELYD